mgnify:CR=1 FL=1|jgi:hypothetical protein
MTTTGGLILSAIALIILGVVLQSDLVAWLVDAMGMAFVAAGVLAGIGGIIGLLARAKA